MVWLPCFSSYGITIIIVFNILVVNGDSDARLIQGNNMNLVEAQQFLGEFEVEASNMCFTLGSSQWTYSTNMTDANKRKMIDEQMLNAKFEQLSWKKATSFNWVSISDPNVKRQLKLIITSDKAGLPDDKYNEIHHLIAEMKDIYNNVRICPFSNSSEDSKFCDLTLEPDVKNVMRVSRNPEEILHIWKEWHLKTGPPMKNKFMRYVQLTNQAARMNGFSDAAEQLNYQYEDDDFRLELSDTWIKIQPLYKELFTYVRRKLIDKYGSNVIRPDGPLPAHLLGNIWAQNWENLYDFTMPYVNIKSIDVTKEMQRQGFNPLRMFQIAEDFYTSLGMKALPPEFWRHSMLERPGDRKVQCTASAWDFCNKIDYRIKQCTDVNADDFISTFKEMAHIQYYIHYAELPFVYRDGANPEFYASGFHEGVANAILLSAFNPTHLHTVALSQNETQTYEANMNYVMKLALQKVAYAPFALIVDQWRSMVFKKGVKNMNSDWWDLRLRFQGLVPPVPRTEQYLDAAAKRHIAADLPYTKYYVGLLLQFQIFEALCIGAGHSGQLHTCDIYKSREAGRLLMDVMKSGRSRPWRDVLRTLTQGRVDRLNAESMLKFFQPLMLWLKIQNKDEETIGWTTSEHDTALFQQFLHTSGARSAFVLEIELILKVVTVISVHFIKC